MTGMAHISLTNKSAEKYKIALQNAEYILPDRGEEGEVKNATVKAIFPNLKPGQRFAH